MVVNGELGRVQTTTGIIFRIAGFRNVTPLIRRKTLKYFAYTVADVILKEVITGYDPAENGRKVSPVENSVKDEVKLGSYIRTKTCCKEGGFKFQTWYRWEFKWSDSGLRDDQLDTTDPLLNKIGFRRLLRSPFFSTRKISSFHNESRKRRKGFSPANPAFDKIFAKLVVAVKCMAPHVSLGRLSALGRKMGQRD